MNKNYLLLIGGVVFTFLVYSFFSDYSKMEDGITVYSARKEALTREVFEAFTKETGIKINVLHDSDSGKLLSRIVNEGDNCSADVFMTADVASLVRAKHKGILYPIHNKEAKSMIPENLQDEGGLWFGLTKRARIMIYSKSRVSPQELIYLTRYEDLANPVWKNRLFMRSSISSYNQFLISSMILHIGEEATYNWAKAVVSNFSKQPHGGDTDQIRAICAGEADISVVNSYYLARLVAQKDKCVDDIGVIFPNANDRGTHVNVSGFAILKNSKNKSNSEKLLMFLLGDKSQNIYASSNQEYPIVSGVPISDVLTGFGELKEDVVRFEDLEKHMETAVKISDKAGWR